MSTVSDFITGFSTGRVRRIARGLTIIVGTSSAPLIDYGTLVGGQIAAPDLTTGDPVDNTIMYAVKVGSNSVLIVVE